MAEEWCVCRRDVCGLHLLKTIVVIENGQRGEKVIARGIGPNLADQTEGFKRFLVISNVIDDGYDEFLRETFASRHGHGWTPPVIATEQNTVNKKFNMSAELARFKEKQYRWCRA
jgi:hypothetical protein